MTTHNRLILLCAILSLYLITAALYLTLTPAWQAPDEPAHYNYIRHLAEQHTLPTLTADCYNQAYLNQLTTARFPPELSIDGVCYEHHQPPLYYVLSLPLFWLGEGSLTVVRLTSLILGLGTLTFTFLTVRTIFPQQPTLWFGTLTFVAFVPMHLTILTAVNNDALGGLIMAILLYLLMQELTGHRRTIHLALMLGLALLTKLTVYLAVPLVGLGLWLAMTEQAWSHRLRRIGLIYTLALSMAAPWYIRNLIVYGHFDLLGLHRHDEIVVGQLRTVDYVAQIGGLSYLSNLLRTTFHSFWGQFGWMAVPMDSRIYWLLTLLTGTALFGLMMVCGQTLRRPHSAATNSGAPSDSLTPSQRTSLGVLLCLIGLVFAAYAWYNAQFVQFQGRYLFAAMIPYGLFLTMGLREALKPRYQAWLIAGLMAVCGGVAFTSLRQGDLDGWRLLLTALPLTLLLLRWAVARYHPIPPAWLLTLIYLALIGLAVAAPFWFIAPNLAPI